MPSTIPITLRDTQGVRFATVQARPVTVCGLTMGLHRGMLKGPRGGIKVLPTWQVTEPATGCSVAQDEPDADAALKAARKKVRDKGGAEAVQARIEQWQKRDKKVAQ